LTEVRVPLAILTVIGVRGLTCLPLALGIVIEAGKAGAVLDGGAEESPLRLLLGCPAELLFVTGGGLPVDPEPEVHAASAMRATTEAATPAVRNPTRCIQSSALTVSSATVRPLFAGEATYPVSLMDPANAGGARHGRLT